MSYAPQLDVAGGSVAVEEASLAEALSRALVSSRTVDLARAMTDLRCNAELRHVMGHAGRERVQREYLWEKKGDRLDALYASVLDNTTAPCDPNNNSGVGNLPTSMKSSDDGVLG